MVPGVHQYFHFEQNVLILPDNAFPNKILNKFTEFIANKMASTIKLFSIKYWLPTKRKLSLTVANFTFLHYKISQRTE